MTFDPSAVQFSHKNAYYLAHFSKLAYDIDRDYESYSIGDDEYCIKYIDHKQSDVQALIAEAETHIIIAVRGTEPDRLRDWITDAQFGLLATAYGYRFHRGFYWGYGSISGLLLPEICERTIGKPKPVFITGHSAGAAIGSILCDQIERYQYVGGLYTFGSPRVGCRQFHKSFNTRFGRAYRIVCNNDIVTRIPPQMFGYSHIGHLWYFDSDGLLFDGADLWWWARMWDRIEGRIDDIGEMGTDGIKDHSMDNYLDLCRTAAFGNYDIAPDDPSPPLHIYEPCPECGERGYHGPGCGYRWNGEK